MIRAPAWAAGDFSHAVPSFRLPNESNEVVPINFDYVDLRLKLDVSLRKATGVARITFETEAGGFPMFDLLANPSRILLDDAEDLPPNTLALVTPPGSPAAVRVLRKPLAPNSRHTLELEYTIPENKITFSATGVALGFFMDDVTAERSFLEQYAPANFEFDHFTLEVSLDVLGATRPHRIFSNGRILPLGERSWRIMFPAFYTTSSFYLHVTERPLEVSSGLLGGIESQVPYLVYGDRADLTAQASAALPGIFRELESVYGAFAHETLTVYVTPGEGGMEHCGATVTSLPALRHEILHSWFGRGVMPAGGNAGWIDEAIATWADYGYRVSPWEGMPIVANLADFSPYRRTTPEAAYPTGGKLMGIFAGLAQKLPGGLKGVLRRFYEQSKYDVVRTSEFQTFLEKEFGRNLDSIFRPAVYNRSEAMPLRSAFARKSLFHRSFTEAERAALR